MNYVRERSTKYYVILDKTIFHPKGGGQPSDIGWLIAEGFRFEVRKVINVKGIIVHYGKVIDGDFPKLGEKVKLILNWEHRYKIMRLHTAGHIIDYAISRIYGHVLNTLDAFHSFPKPYIVYEGPPPAIEELKQVEATANNIVKKAIPVEVTFVGSDELKDKVVNAPNLGRLPHVQKYRIVSIRGINAIPCTGTHVENTKEVGEILVKGFDMASSNSFRLYYDVS